MDDDNGILGIGSLPIGIGVLVLFLVVLARSHATYWAGRGVVRGEESVHVSDRGFAWWRSTLTHLEAWTNSHAAQRGLDLVRRWGAIAVTVAYVTWGLQTAVWASAGLIRMRYAKFALASLPGALVWAVLWATVGLGAVWGAIKLFATSPVVLFLLVAAAIVVGGWWVRRRLLRRARRNADLADERHGVHAAEHHGAHVRDAGRHAAADEG